MKAATLKTIASKIALPGRSKMLKAELEDAVMSVREGRKEVYAVTEAEAAVGIVEDVLKTGTYFLPKPQEPKAKPVTGTFTSFRDLAKATFGEVKDLRTRQREFAAYCGMVRALKNEVRAKGYRQIRWSEDEKGFRLGVVRRQAA